MSELAATIQALLFVSDSPLAVGRLATLTGSEPSEVEAAIIELDGALSVQGINLSHHIDGYRLVTAPRLSVTIKQLMEDQAKSELSKPALETLAIITYRGPISRAGIEAIRGVSSDITLKGLLARGLVVAAGKSDEPGRPQMYKVSTVFLDQFGITDIRQLPPLEEARDAA